jgi:hypothetical protein
MVEDVNAAAGANPFNGRSGLNSEQLNSGLSARKNEDHTDSPRGDPFQLPTKIARHTQAQPARPVS